MTDPAPRPFSAGSRRPERLQPAQKYGELAEADAPALVTELPGPNAREWIRRDERVTSPSMGRVYPLVPERAAGLVIEDVDGNRFLDFNAGIAVTSTGHCHPDVVAAIADQAASLIHYCSSDFYPPVYAQLAERLAAGAPVAGPAKVFLTNSGTEAVEASIKLARHSTGRPNVIAFLGAFHGRSLGSLSLTASKTKYREGFGPLLPGVYHAPYGDDTYLDDVLFRHLVAPDEVAAVIVEPIQGEGGYVVPPPGWLARLRELCTRHGMLLVADEIQSGIGRTGRMWAVEHEGIAPDVVLAGKGIASGMPLGALLAPAELMHWGPGSHGSTFGGNPVACAAALATLDLVEAGLTDNARAMGDLLLTRLGELRGREPLVTDVRGRGLMIGIDLADHDVAVEVEHACFRRGLLLLTCGERAVRFAPALTVRPDQVETAVTIFAEACAEVRS
jgi:4-aminobutyrate aminotransferase